MSVTEFWWEFDTKLREQKAVAKPGMGKFSGAEWEAARKKHKEKMNG